MAKTKLQKSQKISSIDSPSDSNLEELKRTLENGLYIHSSPPKVAGGSGGSKIREHIRAGNISALEEILLAGNGQSLVNQPSTDKHVRSFLKTVPAYMSKIDLVHDAAERGNLRDLKALLDRRKLSRSRDSKGIGLLHKAVLQGHKDVVDYLINEYPESAEVKDTEEMTLPPHLTPDSKGLKNISQIQDEEVTDSYRKFPIFNTLDSCVTKTLKGVKPPIKKSKNVSIDAVGWAKTPRKKTSRGSKDYYLYKQRFMIRPSSAASMRLPVDTAAERESKGGAFDWLKKYVSKEVVCGVPEKIALPNEGQMTVVNTELLDGMEMELATWNPSMGNCECTSLCGSTTFEDDPTTARSNMKTSRLHFPSIDSAPSQDTTADAPAEDAVCDPIQLTKHVTDVNPDIPEFFAITKQVMSRKAKAIETHFQRVTGARTKQTEPLPTSASLNSAFTRLPPISSSTIDKLQELKSAQNRRPATPISPMITPSHSVGKLSMRSLSNSAFGRSQSNSSNGNLDGDLTTPFNSAFKNRNNRLRNSLSAHNVILEENGMPLVPRTKSSSPSLKSSSSSHKSSSPITKSSSPITKSSSPITKSSSPITKSSNQVEKRPFAISWESIKDLIHAKEMFELSKKAIELQTKDEGQIQIVLRFFQIPLNFKKYVTNLCHKICNDAHNSLASEHFSRVITTQRNKKETMQAVYDHDANFWGNMIVDKVLREIEGANDASNPARTESSNKLKRVNSYSDVISLKEEYLSNPREATSNPTTDLAEYATQQIVKNDPRSRPGSGISRTSFMI